MEVQTEAIVCALRHHGEHGGVVRLLTPSDGLVAAYVRGARGRRMRPVLIPGNLVEAQLRARNESQLPQATIELKQSRAGVLSEPLASAAVEWVTGLFAAVLPERQPYPMLFEAAAGFCEAVESAPSAKGWAIGLVRLELLVLAQLGYARRGSSLPAAVREGGEASWAEMVGALDFSGRLLEREILSGRSQSLVDSRHRLMTRLRRAAC